MNKINIESLYTYPLKSAQGICLDPVNVKKTGFEFDRSFAIINEQNEVITARQNPRLLLLNTILENDTLHIHVPNKENISLNVNSLKKENIEVLLFKRKTEAQKLFLEKARLLSDFLEQKVTLIFINPLALRFIKEEYNANPNDVITFNDAAPVHLINKASVNELNTNLEEPVLNTRFRSNIIISGVPAYEEDTWKRIQIGECEFDVITQTDRCLLITIDPVSGKKHSEQEPLRTLVKSKRVNKNSFGVYLVPRKLGAISTKDKLLVLE